MKLPVELYLACFQKKAQMAPAKDIWDLASAPLNLDTLQSDKLKYQQVMDALGVLDSGASTIEKVMSGLSRGSSAISGASKNIADNVASGASGVASRAADVASSAADLPANLAALSSKYLDRGRDVAGNLFSSLKDAGRNVVGKTYESLKQGLTGDSSSPSSDTPSRLLPALALAGLLGGGYLMHRGINSIFGSKPPGGFKDQLEKALLAHHANNQAMQLAQMQQSAELANRMAGTRNAILAGLGLGVAAPYIAKSIGPASRAASNAMSFDINVNDKKKKDEQP